MPLVITAGMDEALHERIAGLLPDTKGTASHRWDRPLSDRTDVEAMLQHRPGVVVLGPQFDAVGAFSIAGMIDREALGVRVMVMVEPSPDAWRRAVAAGVRGVVAPTAPDADIEEALSQAVEASRRSGLIGDDTAEKRSRVITLISPKGGVGKTVLSINLAVALAKVRPDQVVLVDLDLQFGDVAYALMLAPTHTMRDAVPEQSGELDPTTLKLFLTRHETGLHVLCAPDDPAAGEEITADQTVAVLRLIASEFRYVVVDTAGGLGEHALGAIEESTDLVLVSDMDVPSVRNLRKVLDALGSVGMTWQTRHFVLNRADSRVSLKNQDVSAAVGLRIDIEIPSSRQVPISLNEGRPLVLSNPRSPVSRQIGLLAGRFAAEAVDSRKATKGRRR